MTFCCQKFNYNWHIPPFQHIKWLIILREQYPSKKLLEGQFPLLPSLLSLPCLYNYVCCSYIIIHMHASVSNLGSRAIPQATFLAAILAALTYACLQRHLVRSHIGLSNNWCEPVRICACTSWLSLTRVFGFVCTPWVVSRGQTAIFSYETTPWAYVP